MNATLKTALISSILGISAFGAAHGATVGTMKVMMTVNGSCDVGVPAVIDFGAVNAGAQVSPKAGAITVKCTAGENPKITLTSGNAWRMEGTGTGAQGNNSGHSVNYTLHFGSGTGQLWNQDNPVSVIGTGVAQELAIYATADTTAVTHSGVYADTVTVSLTF